MGAQQQEGKKTKVPLNSSDKLFKEIRNQNFEVVVQVLRQRATSMKQDYTEMQSTLMLQGDPAWIGYICAFAIFHGVV